MSTWPMWAQRRHGEFQHVGSRSYADSCGTPDPVPVTVAEVAPGDPEATHWGWIRLTRWSKAGEPFATESIPEDEYCPEMIWPSRAAFDVQFPYGPDAEEKRGKGRVVRLLITGVSAHADGTAACDRCGKAPGIRRVRDICHICDDVLLCQACFDRHGGNSERS